MTLNEFAPIFVMIIIAIVLAFIILMISRVFGPFRPSFRKNSPYESGMKPIGPGTRRMPVKFYLVAVLFIIFDIEVIFFLPWAVTFKALGVFGFFEMLVFIAILLVGYIWVWKKGALEWE